MYYVKLKFHPQLSWAWKKVLWIFFSVLWLLWLCVRLFICALWSPAGKGLTSWLSFVVSNCEFVTFPLVSWVRWCTWLYRFLIFVPLLTILQVGVHCRFQVNAHWLLQTIFFLHDSYISPQTTLNDNLLQKRHKSAELFCWLLTPKF